MVDAGAVESSTYVWPAEHGDVLPAPSVAVALKVIVESSPTLTVRPALPNAAAVPDAAAAPEQSAVVKTRTSEPASALPVTAGAFSFAGDTGVVPRPLGVAGAVESSTYVNAAEHVEVLFALSVAVAAKLVVESLATETVKPGDANVATGPDATGAPEQSEVE
jgi:hypothetical protein